MENQEQEMTREFKGIWIPKEVWLDTRLNAIEKVLLVEIDSLDNEDGCFASNEYFANFCQCSVSKITKSISKLKELGYIYLSSYDGRQRFLRSRLSNFTIQTGKIYESDKYNLRGLNNNNIYNNNDKNNTMNNTNNNINNKKGDNEKKKTDNIADREQQLKSFNLNSDELENAILDWLRYKYERKEKYQETGFKTLVNRVIKYSEKYGVFAVCEAIETAMANGWSGMILERLDKNNSNKSLNKNNNYDKFNDIFDKI